MAKLRMRRRDRTAAGPEPGADTDPDFWDDHTEDRGHGPEQIEDVSAWLELPPDFKAPDDDGGAYIKSFTFQLDLAVVEEDDDKWSALDWAE